MHKTERSKMSRVFHPDCEFYQEDIAAEGVPEVLARECSDPRVNIVGMVPWVGISGTPNVTIYFSRKLVYESHTRMSLHDVIRGMKDIGRDDLAEALAPEHHSGCLLTNKDVATLIAKMHDRAFGKTVNFASRTYVAPK